MRALVTGGCGFIGSHLAEKLLIAGHEVRVLDNLSRGSIQNISGFVDHPKLTIVEADITKRDDLEGIFENIDWVFHLAGIADIIPSIEEPDIYFSTNALGTLNVLQSSHKALVKRFIYAASSSCYGIPEGYPTSETAVIQPRYPYALTKHIGEELVIHWGQVYKIPTISLRLFNVYGPRSRTNGSYGAVFGVFLAQKANGRPFTVVGDGNQSRDFTYVTDVVDAFIMAAESNLHSGVFNVGSGHSHSINYLVSLLGGEAVHIAKRPGEPDMTFADITKIANAIGWAPKVSFEAGVANLVTTIDSWRDAPIWDPQSIGIATASWFKHLD